MKDWKKPLHPTSAANGKSFESDYWQNVYGDGSNIDANFNAVEHANYIASILRLMDVTVNSVIDIGFGKACLLKEVVQKLMPEKVIAIDPSVERINELMNQKWISSWNIAILNATIESFDGSLLQEPIDLGIFNSVAQYIQTDMDKIFSKLAKITRYLYFSVPTKTDYDRFKREVDFFDPYAYTRTKSFYYEMLSPYFTIVSYNLLESKRIPKTSYSFMDEFYRF